MECRKVIPKLKLVGNEPLNSEQIKELFSYVTENKYFPDKESAIKKADRRINTIIMYYCIYKKFLANLLSQKFKPNVVYETLENVNFHFANSKSEDGEYILSKELITNAYSELCDIYLTLCDNNMTTYEKAKKFSNIQIANYSKLVFSVFQFYSQRAEWSSKVRASKVIKRIKNMETQSKAYIEHSITEGEYAHELYSSQEKFFRDFLKIYANSGKNNLFIFLLRYDYKTKKS